MVQKTTPKEKQVVYRDQYGNVSGVDAAELLHQANNAGKKVAHWFRERHRRKLNERLENLRIKERELRLLNEIKELEARMKS